MSDRPPYDVLAGEYYDPSLHPTCANFRDASGQLLAALMPDASPSRSCEVGAGSSLLARLLDERGAGVDGLLLTDESAAMLEHSRAWEGRGARLAVARADSLSVGDGSIDLLVASLADPYDDAAFWAEVARVLSPDGRCVATVPSWAWGERFRANGAALDVAEFELADGRVVVVPSLLHAPSEQEALVAAHGLTVLDTATVAVGDLRGPVSPKLAVLGPDEPAVVGYVVGRAG